MKIVFSWAGAVATSGPATVRVASRPMASMRALMVASLTALMRKRPQPELLLRDLPESREAARLDDQEEDDQPAKDHQLDLLLEGHRQLEPHRVWDPCEEDRDEDDEAGTQKRAQDRPK